MKEIEVKILEIDREACIARLRAMGATLEFQQQFEANYYDYPDSSLHQENKNVRLRREGDRSVLTLKTKGQQENTQLKILEETETEVADFATMDLILSKLGLNVYKSSSKTRAQYAWKDSHIVFDKYHGEQEHIPEFIEIESPNEGALKSCLQALGFTLKDTSNFNAFELFEFYANRTSKP